MRMPRGSRGPGRGRRGDVRNVVLALLSQEPMNGYQIIKTVAERTGDLWKPGPGSVYPALGLLEDEGLIQQESAEGSRKTFALTDAGREYVASHTDELADPFERVTSPHASFLDAREEIGRLAMAVQQVVVAGDDKQIAATRSLLADTRRAVYRILAEEDTASDT
ncbi:PadR family transcriptional regulator [Luteipulveratus sp. YIM 133132]|uniref:PadR family transcriptional regulator n=1 Tax=Luteipulveratus flavus TaxID=3031728 RepID=UPI0023B02312|nr:PadR family transcriptional regulator [Luteipulveratus sp. YIM 133132]MDE9367399.1 PadR family transcriptional regulator [Luteipulveratus sp. YIM 133132]